MARGYSERVEQKILTQMRRGSKHRKMIAKRANLNESTVGATLALMAKEGKVTRIGRGLYVINSNAWKGRATKDFTKATYAEGLGNRLQPAAKVSVGRVGGKSVKAGELVYSRDEKIIDANPPVVIDDRSEKLISAVVITVLVLICIGFIAALVAWVR